MTQPTCCSCPGIGAAEDCNLNDECAELRSEVGRLKGALELLTPIAEQEYTNAARYEEVHPMLYAMVMDDDNSWQEYCQAAVLVGRTALRSSDRSAIR